MLQLDNKGCWAKKLEEATKANDKYKTPLQLNKEAQNMQRQMNNEQYCRFHATFIDANPYNPFADSSMLLENGTVFW